MSVIARRKPQSKDGSCAAIAKLKLLVAGRPLTVFFAVMGVALGAFCVFVVSRPDWPPAAGWLHRDWEFMAAIAGLATLVCCWALSDPVTRARRLGARLAIAAAVTAVGMSLLIAQQLLFVREVVVGGQAPAISSVGQVRIVIGDPLSWLQAVVAGLVLSGMVSRSDVVRRSARALVSCAERRVRPLCLVALGAPVALTALAVAGVKLSSPGGITAGPFGLAYAEPTQFTTSALYRGSVAYVAVGFLSLLLLRMPFVFAWYGFVAGRLERHVAPLVTALVIGLCTTVPDLAVSRIYAAYAQGPTALASNSVLLIASEVAFAIIGVCLVQQAHGGLFPTLLLLAAGPIAVLAAVSWVNLTFDQLHRYSTIDQWAWIAFAAVVAVATRMWRRTEADDSPAVGASAGPHPLWDYDVVVRDVSTPF